jgi:hypothetical protein
MKKKEKKIREWKTHRPIQNRNVIHFVQDLNQYIKYIYEQCMCMYRVCLYTLIVIVTVRTGLRVDSTNSKRERRLNGGHNWSGHFRCFDTNDGRVLFLSCSWPYSCRTKHFDPSVLRTRYMSSLCAYDSRQRVLMRAFRPRIVPLSWLFEIVESFSQCP